MQIQPTVYISIIQTKVTSKRSSVIKNILHKQKNKREIKKLTGERVFIIFPFFWWGLHEIKCLYNFLEDGEMIGVKENRPVEHMVLHKLAQ